MAHIDRGPGNDYVSGTPLADLIHPGDGDDVVYAGNGNDVVDDGFSHPWWIVGPNGPLLSFNVGGDDFLYGQAGHDTLRGAGGDDMLSGGTGNDVLTGGLGSDDLYGGLDRDRFDFNSTLESTGSTRDIINDFSFAGPLFGDVIDVAGIDADATLDGNQQFNWSNSTSGAPARGVLKAVGGPGDSTLILGNTNDNPTPELRIQVEDGAVTAATWEGALHFLL